MQMEKQAKKQLNYLLQTCSTCNTKMKLAEGIFSSMVNGIMRDAGNQTTMQSRTVN